jgi:hypothetical protein
MKAKHPLMTLAEEIAPLAAGDQTLFISAAP